MSGQAHPVRPLHEALRSHLLAQSAITAILGQAVHETLVRGAKPPFIAFGDAVVRDAGATGGEAFAIEFDLLIHAAERGRHAALDLMADVEAALRVPLPPLADHRLVSIESGQGAVRHDATRNLTRASLRLRAFLEPF